MVSEDEKFEKGTSLASGFDQPLPIRGVIPGEGVEIGAELGEWVVACDVRGATQLKLEKKLAQGGEGSVFSTNRPQYVAKIYRRDKLTVALKSKLKLMIEKGVSCRGVCFPEALILNGSGEFVGFLMGKASGYELGKSVFQPQLLQQKFPGWTKRETIELCITLLEKIEYLNNRNIILGDINPSNILVASPFRVYLVDCDSYQVEGYPCPVGTANFTAPEVQGLDYKKFLRTQEMENFAIATLLFMIMLPGKPPYSAVGGESPTTNIRNGDFPYPLVDEAGKVPPGKWGLIWEGLPFIVKAAFYETFRKGQPHFAPDSRYRAGEWLEIFRSYRMRIDDLALVNRAAAEIFPSRRW